MKSDRPVSPRSLQLQLDAGSGDPLFLQISRAITADIQRGRLKSGARLPGTRTLAETLDVHRNTVIAAYAELASEGWIESSRASGTFVARTLPTIKPRAFAPSIAGPRSRTARPGFELRGPAPALESLASGNVLLMTGGVPDVRLAPVRELARAYARVLRKEATAVLGYSSPWGHARLRSALAAMLSMTRGLATDADDVLVTHGSQMGLDLIARALIEPGDVVAVEALGYRYAWEAFRQHGAKLVPIPIDDQGLDVAALERLAARTRVRAVCVTPHHQYPTIVTMSASRRVALLSLAQRHGIAIVEDDYDHEFHYEGRPVLPLASADVSGNVVYIGSLSKILAPGVRLGYVVAPRALLDRLASLRAFVDRQGDHAVELAVAQLIEDGTIQRGARRARRVYQARRDLLAEQLRKRFGSSLSVRIPTGSMGIWAQVAPEVDPERWAERARAVNVLIRSGRSFTFDGKPCPFVRLGFAALDEREIGEASKRLAQAWKEARGNSG